MSSNSKAWSWRITLATGTVVGVLWVSCRSMDEDREWDKECCIHRFERCSASAVSISVDETLYLREGVWTYQKYENVHGFKGPEVSWEVLIGRSSITEEESIALKALLNSAAKVCRNGNADAPSFIAYRTSQRAAECRFYPESELDTHARDLITRIRERMPLDRVRHTTQGDDQVSLAVELCELLRRPDIYDGRRISTAGYYSNRLKSRMILLRLTDDEVEPPQGIDIRSESAFYKNDLENEEGARVGVVGTFIHDADYLGGGYLTRVTMVQKIPENN